jgi:ABC-type Zn2+ transport system substrate-binding protein/surface adhesin
LSFRIKKLPKSEEDMREIVREIQEREEKEHGAEVEHAHGHHHDHTHDHYHTHETSSVSVSAELLDAIAHIMEHQLGELAQISERTNRMSRSIDDLVSSIDELKELVKVLIKLQLAQLIEDRDTKKKLIADAIDKL